MFLFCLLRRGAALRRGLLALDEFIFGVSGGHRVGGRGVFLLHGGVFCLGVHLLFILALLWGKKELFPSPACRREFPNPSV